MPPTQASASLRRAFFARFPLALLFLACTAASAHPLKAPPLQHPHVFVFDQFYLPEDDDTFLAQGGLVLLAELNCAACHAAPQPWSQLIGPKPGPDLRGVGSRLDMDALWRLIRSPQHRKPGTQMPGLFSGNQETDPDTIEAIATYLATLTQDIPTPAPGDPARGRTLYHSVGCVACHEPGTDHRPASLPAEAELERPSLASSPIALADDYSFPALTQFLLDPLSTRPASRMPAQHLTVSEAADIAAYLHTDRLPPAFQERRILNLSPQPATLGQRLFFEHRCHSCHDTGEKNATTPPPPLPAPLAKLDPDAATGCLSAQTVTGIPDYDLSPLQLRALRLALKSVQTQPQPALTRTEQLTHHLSRLNCFACHDHDGRGGPEIARALYFTATLRQRPNDDLEHLPPSLDKAFQSFSAETFLQRLTQPAATSPPGTRMPLFSLPAVSPLSELLHR